MRAPSLLLTALLASPALAAAPPASPSSPPIRHGVTVDWIFSDDAEALARPTRATWTSDGTVLMLDERRRGPERTFERVDPVSLSRSAALDAGVALASLRTERAGKGAAESLEWPASLDRAGRLAAYVFDGDLFLLRFADSKFERLTRTETAEALPRLSPDGRKLAFVRDNDLWLLDLSDRAQTRLTHDGSGTILNGRLSWLYWEEIFNRAEDGILWSPDSSALAFLRTDESPVAVSTFVDIEPATPRVIEQRYPTAGGANPLVRLGLYDLASGRTSWLDPSTVPYEYLVQISWLDDSRALGVVTLDRAQDRTDLYRVDRAGAARHVLTQTDPAWVNLIDFHFLAQRAGVVATSQVDGYTHLYLYGPDGERPRALTSGEWSVRGSANWQASTIATTIDEAHGYAYFTARRPDMTQIQLYRVGLDGSGLERLSSETGGPRGPLERRSPLLSRLALEPRPPAVAFAPRRVGGGARGALEIPRRD